MYFEGSLLGNLFNLPGEVTSEFVRDTEVFSAECQKTRTTSGTQAARLLETVGFPDEISISTQTLNENSTIKSSLTAKDVSWVFGLFKLISSDVYKL